MYCTILQTTKADNVRDIDQKAVEIIMKFLRRIDNDVLIVFCGFFFFFFFLLIFVVVFFQFRALNDSSNLSENSSSSS